MGRPDTIQWNCKQWLGDNKVLAMDWDAQGMHFHLLMISTQEKPAGSIPNDVLQIRRWLRLPSGQSESDRVWARVQPQIFAAWILEDERWFNPGMVATFERKALYAGRYENGTKTVREIAEKDRESGNNISISSKEISIQELTEENATSILGLDHATEYVFLELGMAGMDNRVACADAVKSFIHGEKCSFKQAAEEIVRRWALYEKADVQFRCGKAKWLKDGVWKNPELWERRKDSLDEKIRRNSERRAAMSDAEHLETYGYKKTSARE